MAKGRVRSRMELREQNDAAEARERENKPKADDDDDDDLGDIATAEPDADEAEEAPVKKKKKKAATEPKPRKKVTKVVRKRVVWVVYDNSNKKIAQFDYTKKADADALAEKLKGEKKTTYFVQPFKEEMAAE